MDPNRQSLRSSSSSSPSSSPPQRHPRYPNEYNNYSPPSSQQQQQQQQHPPAAASTSPRSSYPVRGPSSYLPHPHPGYVPPPHLPTWGSPPPPPPPHPPHHHHLSTSPYFSSPTREMQSHPIGHPTGSPPHYHSPQQQQQRQQQQQMPYQPHNYSSPSGRGRPYTVLTHCSSPSSPQPQHQLSSPVNNLPQFPTSDYDRNYTHSSSSSPLQPILPRTVSSKQPPLQQQQDDEEEDVDVIGPTTTTSNKPPQTRKTTSTTKTRNKKELSKKKKKKEETIVTISNATTSAVVTSTSFSPSSSPPSSSEKALLCSEEEEEEDYNEEVEGIDHDHHDDDDEEEQEKVENENDEQTNTVPRIKFRLRGPTATSSPPSSSTKQKEEQAAQKKTTTSPPPTTQQKKKKSTTTQLKKNEKKKQTKTTTTTTPKKAVKKENQNEKEKKKKRTTSKFQQQQQQQQTSSSKNTKSVMETPPDPAYSSSSASQQRPTTSSLPPPQQQQQPSSSLSPPPPTHLYLQKLQHLNGKCAACFGSRDIEAFQNSEPILLCDGLNCNREYHLKCIVPTITEVPEGDFICVDCDAYGSTKYLMSYFEEHEEKRAEFDTSCEYVLYLVEKHMREEMAADNGDGSGGDDDEEEREEKEEKEDDDVSENTDDNHDDVEIVHIESEEEDGGGEGGSDKKRKKNLSLLGTAKKRTKTEKEDEDESKEQIEDGRDSSIDNDANSDRAVEPQPPPKSELRNIEILHKAAIAGVPKRSSTEKKKTEETSNDNSINSGSKANDSNNRDDDDDKTEFGPSSLVGKLIRLYCPNDNIYHVGRIVDWRAARLTAMSNSHSDGNNCKKGLFYGDDEIATSEFLVRFSPGMDGRKKLLLQWIILEEHSLAVGMSIVWAKLNKSRGLSGWKPAQTLIRTSLELIPVRHLLNEDEDGELYGKQNGATSAKSRKVMERWALALFFSEEKHSLLRLRDEAEDLFSPTFHSQLVKNGYATCDSKDDSAPKTSAADLNRSLDLPLALAMAEHEEQRRTNYWHKMILHDPAHKRALTIADEHALPPVPIPQPECDSSEAACSGVIKEEDSDDDHAESESEDLGKNTITNIPQLCPLIETGLDRMWLAHTMGAEFGQWSKDSMDSISCQGVQCTPLAMARLNEERKLQTSAFSS